MPPSQDQIYYLSAPSWSLAKQSPYYEAFEKKGIEVRSLRLIGDFNLMVVVS